MTPHPSVKQGSIECALYIGGLSEGMRFERGLRQGVSGCVTAEAGCLAPWNCLQLAKMDPRRAVADARTGCLSSGPGHRTTRSGWGQSLTSLNVHASPKDSAPTPECESGRRISKSTSSKRNIGRIAPVGPLPGVPECVSERSETANTSRSVLLRSGLSLSGWKVLPSAADTSRRKGDSSFCVVP